MDMKHIVIGICIILLAGFAGAISLEGSCSSESYQCDLSVKDLKVCNNSSVADTYTVSVSGEAADWVNVIPDKVKLGPGECKELHVYTIAECYAEPGLYGVDITVADGTSATVHCDIKINQGHRMDIEVIPEEQTATQCEEKEYTLRLENKSAIQHQKTETVGLSIQGLDESWAILEKGEVLVTKGTPEEVSLKIRAPCETPLGEYPFQAIATLVNPKFYSTDTGAHIIAQGQEIELDTGIDAGGAVACRTEATSRTVEVTNKGRLRDTIVIELDGPDWVSVSESEFTLEPNASKELTLNFSPTETEEGNYEVKVKARSAPYGYETEDSFNVNLQKCHGLIVEKISGAEKTCMEENPEYEFKVTNIGTKDASVDFAIKGVNAELDKDSSEIGAGESVNVGAVLDVSGIVEEAKIIKRENEVAVEVMVDSSGSMLDLMGGRKKMDIGKEAVNSFVDNVINVELGLRVFGQGQDCEGSQLLMPISKIDRAEVKKKVTSMKPLGKTPIGEALESSVADFPEGKEKYVIIVSDGKETCGADLDAVAQKLKQSKVVVYAIGFDIDAEGKEQLESISRETGGSYFEAGNAEELAGVFHTIGVELKIIPATGGDRDFSFEASAKDASAAEQYAISVEDCYNVAVIAPSLGVCKGIETSAVLEIRNIGTKNQVLDISVEPSWISAEGRVEVESNAAKTIALTAIAPKNAAGEQLSVTAVSDDVETRDTGNISYLSEETCFEIEIQNENNEIDAAACDGETFSIVLENKGKAKQTVNLSVDKGWVYLDEEEVSLEKGEKKEVYFLISPPYDISEEQTTITIRAESNYGFVAETSIELNVFGANTGVQKVDLQIEQVDILKQAAKAGDNAEIKFAIVNRSGKQIKIEAVEALGAEAEFEVADSVLKGSSQTAAQMSLVVKDGAAKKVVVPVKIVTNEGTFVRLLAAELEGFEVGIPDGSDGTGSDDNSGSSADSNAGSDLFTGFVGLQDFGGLFIGVLVAIVIALIGYGLYKSKPGNEASGNNSAIDRDARERAIQNARERAKAAAGGAGVNSMPKPVAKATPKSASTKKAGKGASKSASKRGTNRKGK